MEQLVKKESENQGSLFEKYQLQAETEEPSEIEKLELDLRKVIYEISSAQVTGEVLKTKEQSFICNISITKLKISEPQKWRISLKPISLNNSCFQELDPSKSILEHSFAGFEQHRLTPFFVFQIEDVNAVLTRSFVLKFDIDLGEDRNTAILKHILGNQEKVFKFLIFLLAKDQVEPLLYLDEQEELLSNTISKNKRNSKIDYFPIYEKLLYAASRDSQSLASVIDVVEMLQSEADEKGDSLISDEFKKLIEVFKNLDA